tara:strand:- start:12599 stop:13675 length:1077 start_codon:yes stop_codon:yes gene_type:complete
MDETPVIATLSDDAAEAAQNITTLEDYQKVRGALVKDSADARFKDEGLPFEADPPTDDAVVASTPVEAVEPDAVETSDNTELAKEKKSRPPRTGRAKTAKARIDKIVWEREEARKEVEQLRHQLQSIQAPAAKDSPVIPAAVATPSSGPVSPDAPTTDVEPLESSYAEYGEFVTAKARWAARQEVSKAFQDAQQHQDASLQQQYYADRVSSFAEKMARGSEHDPEFLAKVPSEILNLRPAMSLGAGEEPTGATAIADVLLESETPQILMAYLSSHEDDFRRISALHPMLAMREIGRIEVGLDAVPNGSASTPVSSQAQPPIRPVGSSSAKPQAAHRAPADINSLAEWRVARSQLLHQR